jgi:exopolyphosphatase / guanosine-5'-triphosphate,3'-diphosphate pyrophosphatase
VTDAVAAVDCGTNSTRLLVVDGHGAVVAREMRITRLGEGVDSGRRLQAPAAERTFSVLRGYRRIMEEAGVVSARVVATSAVRDARNAAEFMREVANLTGADPEVLSGDEEAYLSFRGATAHLPPGQEPSGSVLVVDIGGGSTEVAVGPAPEGNPPSPVTRERVQARSLDIGCVRVSERYFAHDPPHPDELEAARVHVYAQLVAARDGLPALPADPLFLGLAGTVSTIASLVGGLTTYDRDRIHHAVLSRSEVDRWTQLLAAEDARGRLRRPGMVSGREDVIVGGALIFAVVMEVFDCRRCIVSEEDILDGLVDTLRSPPSDGQGSVHGAQAMRPSLSGATRGGQAKEKFS